MGGLQGPEPLLRVPAGPRHILVTRHVVVPPAHLATAAHGRHLAGGRLVSLLVSAVGEGGRVTGERRLGGVDRLGPVKPGFVRGHAPWCWNIDNKDRNDNDTVSASSVKATLLLS